MRIFAGLPIPGEIIENLREVCSFLREKYRGLKVVKSEGLHVTLHFFGELQKHTADELINLMDDQSLRQKKIKTSFKGFSQFPPRGNPKVLYVNIGQGKDEIISYYKLFFKLIRSHGFVDSAQKKFIPHITIARNKQEKLPRNFPDSIPFTLNDSFMIDRCILYNSILKPTGAEYEALKTVVLKS